MAVESKSGVDDPTWFPDGDSIVFGSQLLGQPQSIVSIELQTRRVTTIPGSEGLHSPRLSPDGRFIVTVNYPGQTRQMLFDLGKQKWSQLFESAQRGLGWPQWSADFVYARDARDQHDPVLYRILRARHRPALERWRQSVQGPGTGNREDTSPHPCFRFCPFTGTW